MPTIVVYGCVWPSTPPVRVAIPSHWRSHLRDWRVSISDHWPPRWPRSASPTGVMSTLPRTTTPRWRLWNPASAAKAAVGATITASAASHAAGRQRAGWCLMRSSRFPRNRTI